MHIINDIARSYQCCYHPSMQIIYHVVRRKRNITKGGLEDTKKKSHKGRINKGSLKIRISKEKNRKENAIQTKHDADIRQEAIKATKVAIMLAREALNHGRTVQKTPRASVPILKQPTFNWKALDKYHE